MISIIIPAKNEEAYIGKCLQGISALNFDQTKLEVIVVDNGSTDQTKLVSRSNGAMVIDVRQGNIGELRNKGAQAANGEIFAFIDADCVPDKDWLINAVKVLKDKTVAAVGSKPEIPETDTSWIEKTWSLMKQIPKKGYTNWLSSSNFIVKKVAFEQVNGFDPGLITCEDADIGYRISRSWKMVNDPDVKIFHLREPKTIKEFFNKEKWHGADNFRGFFNHGLKLQEIPSLSFPLVTGASIILFLIGTGLFSFKIMMLSLFIFFLPPILQTLKVIKRIGISFKIFPIFFLFTIYSMARFVAIIPTK